MDELEKIESAEVLIRGESKSKEQGDNEADLEKTTKQCLDKNDLHQQQDRDKEGRLLREFWLDANSLIQGIFKAYYPKTGELESTMSFIDGILNGKVMKLKKGQKASEIDFKNGLMDGDMKIFNNGIMVSLMSFSKGLLAGITKSWDKDGNLTNLVNYDNGVEHGFSYSYYAPDKEVVNDNNEPKIQSKCHYYHGTKQGLWEMFYNDGKLMEEGSFEKGKKHGTFIRYYPSGEISQKIHYQEGKVLKGGIMFDPKGYEITA